MSKMKAIQIEKAGGDFQLVNKDIPAPKKNEVLIKVEACGICHSDMFVKEGLFPGISYPRTPGHEVVGIIDKLGEDVNEWKIGQRVGVGWHGGHCFTCEPCRKGDFVNCEKAGITGISSDGGYAEYMTANHEALAIIPEDLSSAEAAPLLCAGITTYNSLRNSGIKSGDVVAVHGIGGLGHLGVQFAHKMGMKTVAISRGSDKKDLALKLGANIYIDTESQDAAAELQKLGGAKVILATAPNSKAISGLVNGLGIGGKLLVVAASPEPLEISPLQLLMGRKSVAGWPSGSAKDSEDTLNFSSLSGIRPQIEIFPIEKAAEAYETMMSNKARFRVVLDLTI